MAVAMLTLKLTANGSVRKLRVMDVDVEVGGVVQDALHNARFTRWKLALFALGQAVARITILRTGQRGYYWAILAGSAFMNVGRHAASHRHLLNSSNRQYVAQRRFIPVNAKQIGLACPRGIANHLAHVPVAGDLGAAVKAGAEDWVSVTGLGHFGQ